MRQRNAWAVVLTLCLLAAAFLAVPAAPYCRLPLLGSDAHLRRRSLHDGPRAVARRSRRRPADLPPLELIGYDRVVSGELSDTGNTIEVAITGEPAPALSVPGTTYTLEQFHFHEPSEHRKNGVGRAMEAAPRACRRGRDDRRGRGPDAAGGRPAQPDHPALMEAGAGRVEKHARIKVRPSLLLPADRGYYCYDGSLTTPPCTEGVRWHVLRGEIALSPRQVAASATPTARAQPSRSTAGPCA